MVSQCFLSCSKAKHDYISNEFLSWCYFNKGSYWIYQNDSTLVMDSVFLISNPLIGDIPRDQDKGSTTYQHIAITFSSKFYNHCQLVTGPGGIEVLGNGYI